MLFNSYIFLFIFLPVTLLGYYFIGKRYSSRAVIIWLVAASLVFFAWSNPIYLILLSASVLFNYAYGRILVKPIQRRTLIMALGVAANILLLGYFKYANFFIDNINALFDTGFHLETVVLPLAISFFTLQQITYLVDIYRGQWQEHGFWDYCLFVTFFPKLLSGPIVRMREMMPQIGKNFRPRLSTQVVSIALTILFLGLFKKVVLADQIGTYVAPVFDAATRGSGISFFNSWTGALGYTFQLYFDFSAYSDIAIGLGLLFGIKLPLNFYSPYKSKSIIEFWRRWHITLSTFIRDYLYIPMGGNRHGFARQVIYLLAAMAIAGLWHGAGWTFVIWGGLHGFYLAVNHGWRRLKKALGIESDVQKSPWWSSAPSTLFTFIAVTIAWVFFRADSLSAAVEMFKGMFGVYGFHLPVTYYAPLGAVGQFLNNIGVSFDLQYPLPGFVPLAIIWILIALFICWFLPNVQEYMSDFQPALEGFRGESKKPRFSWLRWKPSLASALVVSIIIALAFLGLNQVTQFIYFRF
ncbi:MAG: MBOAT family protein [Dehalococcoidales bacterium]|nr:MBOAT family protein [Dehalococcoidales bacterium]